MDNDNQITTIETETLTQMAAELKRLRLLRNMWRRRARTLKKMMHATSTWQ